MNPDSYVIRWLDLMARQFHETYALLADLPEERLWQRPAAGEWCIGEILDHTRILNRSFRRLIAVTWPLLRLRGQSQRARPWTGEIDDVYARPGFPMGVGWMWSPRHTPQRPVSLAQLEGEASAEYDRIRAWYQGKPEDVLGNTYLYDPAIGWLNLVQVLRVGCWHDDLHFRDVRGMGSGEWGLGSGEVRGASGV